ncbi:aryl carrier domain [Corynebacterium mustelae]|uniref:Aryl carrier domain n=1 Tax=Corynebacterium mustelae TaxID=571915 RepID=A0A0G3H5U1_9CORY|nr:acyl carrier protein [Corynebacterium mustelae]AKK07193.1 aryl carrier domain [Corynebacterium mustelae]
MTYQQSIILHFLSDLFDDEVQPGDNFIDLGGNSITALALEEQLAQKGIQVSINEILSEPIGEWGKRDA